MDRHPRPHGSGALTGDAPAAVTTARAARMLDTTARVVRHHIARGRLPAVRLGRRILIPVAAIRRLLDGGGP